MLFFLKLCSVFQSLQQADFSIFVGAVHTTRCYKVVSIVNNEIVIFLGSTEKTSLCFFFKTSYDFFEFWCRYPRIIFGDDFEFDIHSSSVLMCQNEVIEVMIQVPTTGSAGHFDLLGIPRPDRGGGEDKGTPDFVRCTYVLVPSCFPMFNNSCIIVMFK